MSQSKSSGGLVRKVVAPFLIGVAAMGAGKASGEWLTIDTGFNVNVSQVDIYRPSGHVATDGYDSSFDVDASLLDIPTVDFYSKITGHNLSQDVRDSSSLTPYDFLMQGRGLDIQHLASGNLHFVMDNPATDFPGFQIFADLYETKGGIQSLLNKDIDVRDWAAHGYDRPLGLDNNNDFYTLNVKFIPEPGTGKMLGAGALLAGLISWCRNRRTALVHQKMYQDVAVG